MRGIFFYVLRSKEETVMSLFSFYCISTFFLIVFVTVVLNIIMFFCK